MKTSDSPQLAAPGAGLPAPELFIARKLFALKCGMGNRESFIAGFKAERMLIRELVEACPDGKLVEPVLVPRLRGMEDSSRFWSLAMTLEHLRIVNEGIGHFITELSRERELEGRLGIADVKPDPAVTDAVVSAYEEACDGFLEQVAAAGNLKSKTTYPHPWFGPMDAFRWLALASIHMRIHRRQIAAILGGLNT